MESISYKLHSLEKSSWLPVELHFDLLLFDRDLYISVSLISTSVSPSLYQFLLSFRICGFSKDASLHGGLLKLMEIQMNANII